MSTIATSKTLYQHTCERFLCAYTWTSELECPKQCPRCKRMDWNQPPKARTEAKGEQK